MTITLPGKIHATSIFLPDTGAGVLIAGAPGAGKSDLALRMIDAGALLISDDYTDLSEDGGRLAATAPATIAGLIEIRGLGVVRLDDAQLAPGGEIALYVELATESERGRIARLPEPAYERIGACKIPRMVLCAFDASAPAKLRAAVRLALDPARRIE